MGRRRTPASPVARASEDRRSGRAGWRVLRLPGLLAAAAAVLVAGRRLRGVDREPLSATSAMPTSVIARFSFRRLRRAAQCPAAPRDLEWSPSIGAASYDVVAAAKSIARSCGRCVDNARVSLPGRWWHSSNQARRSCGKSPRGTRRRSGGGCRELTGIPSRGRLMTSSEH